jgi:hypothetical protein
LDVGGGHRSDFSQPFGETGYETAQRRDAQVALQRARFGVQLALQGGQQGGHQ